MQIEWRWHRQTLPDLIDRLKQAGFRLTISEVLDATHLIKKLSSWNPEQLSNEQLKNYLRPLLCKVSDAGSQQRFDEVFDQWLQSPPIARTELLNQAEPHRTDHLQASSASVQLFRRRNYRVLVFFAALLIVLIFAVFHLTARQQVEPTRTPELSAAKSADNSGRINTIPKIANQYERIYGYWPAYRYSEAIRPELAWLLLSLPLSILAFVHLPAMVLSRRRAGSGAQIVLNGWGRDRAAERLVEPLSETIASSFDKHFRGSAKERLRLARRPALDVRRSVEATLNKMGIPQLRYRYACLRPNYLVLIEADSDDALPVLWAERLENLGLDVDIRRFTRPKADETPICVGVSGNFKNKTSFTNLPNPSLGQRLILVSDGGFLLDTQGQWRGWALAAKLERWPVRALFSPREPRDFLAGRLSMLDSGVRAGDPGFLVLPQEDSAIAAWSTWLATGRLPPIILDEPQHFPRLIEQHGETRYLQEAEAFTRKEMPTPQEICRLVSELNIYLGENGFYWLCCCAVPPVMDSGLTLLLGEEYFKRCGVSSDEQLRYYLQRNYRLLARLPWLRHNFIPDWLRLAFLGRLSNSLQQEIRSVVEGLLARQQPNQQGNLQLAFEAPIREFASKDNSNLKDQRHALYLGFMNGLSAQDLTLRLPSAWKNWLGSVRRRSSYSDTCKAWLAAAMARLMFKQGMSGTGVNFKNLLLSTCLLLIPFAFFAIVMMTLPSQWPSYLRGVVFKNISRALIIPNSDKIQAVAFSPDGRRIVSGSWDETLRLWDAESGQPIGRPLKGHKGLVFSVAFSPDGRRIVSGSEDETLMLWDAKSAQPIGRPLEGHKGSVFSVAFSPDGRRIVSGSVDNTLRLWDSESGQPIGRPLEGHKGSVDSVAFSPDGRRIVSSSVDNTLRLWDSESGQPIGRPLEGHEDAVTSVAFSPDGRRIVSGSVDKTLRLWDAESGQPAGQPIMGHSLGGIRVAVSPDGRRIVSGSEDETLMLWDAESGQPIGRPLEGHKGSVVSSVAFSPDGRRIVSGSWDETLRLWDAESGQPIGRPLEGHKGSVDSVAFSPDGRRIVSGSVDKSLMLWDAESAQPIGRPLEGHEDAVTSVAFSPDGRRIVSGSWDKTLRLWDAESGQPIGRPLESHEDAVTSVAFSPDGRRIVSGSEDKTLRLWGTDSGEMLGVLTTTDIIESIAINAQGDFIVAGGGIDDAGYLWRWRIPPYPVVERPYISEQLQVNPYVLLTLTQTVLLVAIFYRMRQLRRRIAVCKAVNEYYDEYIFRI